MPETLRTFIALEVPAEIQQALGVVQDELGSGQDKIKWIALRNIHLTLKFLGQVPEADLSTVKTLIAEAAKKGSVIQAVIKGVGAFPSARAPRVVWAGITAGGEEIKQLSAFLEEGLAKLGFPEEKRSFKPHLTLGRVKYIKDPAAFIEKMGGFKEKIIGKIRINSISLFKSTLTPKGSIYEVLYKADF